jgi:mRNA-degrading endonuclease RelE of RelBE toxin-antitoxin system
MKPSFTAEWLALPPKEVLHILDKINLLTEDPTPDAKTKKQLKYIDPRLHRIRCGDYRIFYTFQAPYVSLLSIKKRKEDTYDDDFDVEFLGGFDPEIPPEQKTNRSQRQWEQFLAPKPPEPSHLPEPITPDLLTRLKIPQHYSEEQARLLTNFFQQTRGYFHLFCPLQCILSQMSIALSDLAQRPVDGFFHKITLIGRILFDEGKKWQKGFIWCGFVMNGQFCHHHKARSAHKLRLSLTPLTGFLVRKRRFIEQIPTHLIADIPRVKGTHPRLYLLLAHALRLSYHRGENPCLMQTRVPELQGELVILSHSFCYLSQDRDRNA